MPFGPKIGRKLSYLICIFRWLIITAITHFESLSFVYNLICDILSVSLVKGCYLISLTLHTFLLVHLSFLNQFGLFLGSGSDRSS
jgi:hypothetical protein